MKTMARMPHQIEVPMSERTPIVNQLLDYIEEQKKQIDILRDEINRLKGHKGKPVIKPSKLGVKEKKGRVSSSKKSTTHSEEFSSNLAVREEKIKAENIPAGSRFKGYRKFKVQDLVIQAEMILYKLERWQLPDGSYVIAKLPTLVSNNHFGPVLRAYVLHQYHHQGVTQPLLLKQLHEWGIEISSGQLNHLLVNDKEKFHKEKDEILNAGLSVSNYIHVDDTGARHAGKNGFCTHIGNELFAWFESTESKSRLNFLNLLRQGKSDYFLNEEAFRYMERQRLAPFVRRKLMQSLCYFLDEKTWKDHLLELGIVRPRHIRIATQAGIIGSIVRNGFSLDTVIMSDDAGQFNIFLHTLCWFHIERNIHKLIPEDEPRLKAVEFVRDQIWDIYKKLKSHKEKPSKKLKKQIEKQFDSLCSQNTCYQLLNLQLKKMRASRDELLLALKRPEIPLHNNLSERDIREYVKRRKISGGTRSNEGRRCRDTFASLKKTAIKLKVKFWDYLMDRITGHNQIPWLPNLIKETASYA
jgi:hypothetical protein